MIPKIESTNDSKGKIEEIKENINNELTRGLKTFCLLTNNNKPQNKSNGIKLIKIIICSILWPYNISLSKKNALQITYIKPKINQNDFFL